MSQMVYVSECPPDSAGTVLSALAESVVSPKIVPWEMSDASVRRCLLSVCVLFCDSANRLCVSVYLLFASTALTG